MNIHLMIPLSYSFDLLCFFFGKIEACKVKVFDKLSEKTERVLEIGIGSGPNMRYYAARNSNVTLYGLDPNPKMKYARKSATKAGLKPKNFRFKQGVSFLLCILHFDLFIIHWCLILSIIR